MGTMFQTGFFNQGMFWMGGGGPVAPAGPWRPMGVRLGQAVRNIPLDTVMRDLSLAEGKAGSVTQWMANRPQYKDILGPDLPRFNTLLDQLSGDQDFETAMSQRLSSPDPSLHDISSDDYQRLIRWENAAGMLYDLTLKHPETAPKPAASAAPAAPAPSAGLSPLAVGVGAAALIGIAALALS